MTVLRPAIGPSEVGLPLAPHPVIRLGSPSGSEFSTTQGDGAPAAPSSAPGGGGPGGVPARPAAAGPWHAASPARCPRDSAFCLALAAPPAERRPPWARGLPVRLAGSYPEKLDRLAPGERLCGVVRIASLAGLGLPSRLVERVSASSLNTAGRVFRVPETQPPSGMRSMQTIPKSRSDKVLAVVY